jgi:hypothetical protein
VAPRVSSHIPTGPLGAGGVDSRRARQAVAALVGMVPPATAGAILNWPWWLDYALIVPSATLLIISGRLVVYRQLMSSAAMADRRVPVALVIPVLLAAAIRSTRFSGLVVAIAFFVVYVFSRHREGGVSTSQVTHDER